MDELIRERIEELTRRLDSEGIDWRARTRQFGDEQVPLLAALATLLELDANEVFRSTRSLEELEVEKQIRRVEKGQIERRLSEIG